IAVLMFLNSLYDRRSGLNRSQGFQSWKQQSVILEKLMKRFFVVCMLTIVFLFALFPQSSAQTETYDLIIANGRIVDGGGNPWFYGDVGIRGDRIAAIADRKSTRLNSSHSQISYA